MGIGDDGTINLATRQMMFDKKSPTWFPDLPAPDNKDWAGFETELMRVDFAEDDVFAMAFVPEKRKEFFGRSGNAEDLSSLVQFGLNGGHKSSPSNLWCKFSKTGFGITTHLRGLRFVTNLLLPEVSRLLNDVGATGSIIFRPPHAKKLPWHIDSGSLEDMFEKTGLYTDVTEWIEDEGTQRLVHLTGASSAEEGSRTCGITLAGTFSGPPRKPISRFWGWARKY